MKPPDARVSSQVPSRRLGGELRRLRGCAKLTQQALADRVHYSRSYIALIETGREHPSAEAVERIGKALDDGGVLQSLHRELASHSDYSAAAVVPPPRMRPAQNGLSFAAVDDEIDALELSRRVAASDVSAETLDRLHDAVDRLASDYAQISPKQLLVCVRRHLAYVTQLVDARKTLNQQRQLLVAGAWLSLLGATLLVDLGERRAAEARLVTAEQMARHAGHREILAWCLETRAWGLLTAGDYRGALVLSQQAQSLAPRGSSAQVQATAQEGRAWARMQQSSQTHDVLKRVHRLVASLPSPERPEHHYQYDPSKAVSYTATTLAWVGDAAAEEYARQALAQIESTPDGTPRPRRAATARLDLGLALVAANKLDEASAMTLTAITSGRIVPSNRWRAEEVVTALEANLISESAELREAYQTFCLVESNG